MPAPLATWSPRNVRPGGQVGDIVGHSSANAREVRSSNTTSQRGGRVPRANGTGLFVGAHRAVAITLVQEMMAKVSAETHSPLCCSEPVPSAKESALWVRLSPKRRSRAHPDRVQDRRAGARGERVTHVVDERAYLGVDVDRVRGSARRSRERRGVFKEMPLRQRALHSFDTGREVRGVLNGGSG
jgi:hypothetical protein